MSEQKVFAWKGFRNGVPRRMLIVAESKAEAARIIGYKGVWRMRGCKVTESEKERSAAFENIGSVFETDQPDSPYANYQECPVNEITDKG
jgi:hypothetical protein